MEKEEQARLREQMRQEAEERKLLEQQQKQIEKEEEKYNIEMAKTKEMLENAKDDEKILQLQSRLKELEEQLNAVHEKKEEIIKLQNGKAGYVYIISNLGSFGESTFKIGMTRRLNPQDRVDELGDASVPFRFDVHSFIFSDSAVDLETKMHNILEKKRVNKINLRKEFFNVTIDELEALVQELYPSAEFNKTMIAENNEKLKYHMPNPIKQNIAHIKALQKALKGFPAFYYNVVVFTGNCKIEQAEGTTPVVHVMKLLETVRDLSQIQYLNSEQVETIISTINSLNKPEMLREHVKRVNRYSSSSKGTGFRN